ncbi:hypothetical protein FXB39_12490 [Nocardioides sp. BGMRC 2183]|nr:hypothetical protein FXB39_12490 [Nocardioides sp. BGMRC 2183]
MPVTTGRTALASIAVALTLTGLAACGADDPRDDAPVLEQAWTSEATGWDAYKAPWVADEETWIYRSYEPNGLQAVDLSDGAVGWHLPMGEVCALSEINDAGLLGVQSGADCATLTVVDTATGQEQWSERVRFPADTYPSARGISLAITEETLSVATHCGIERWSLDQGTFRGRFAEGTPGQRRYCLPSATTGDIALIAGRRSLSAYDVDSGERLWREPGADAGVHRVYAEDPLLVDVSLDGTRGVRTVDARGGSLGPLLGRPLPTIGESPDIAAPLGETVLGAYHSAAGGFEPAYRGVLRGWDLATGEEDWSRLSTGDEYLGADETGAYLGRTIDSSDDGDGYAYWVMRWAEGDTEPQTVGWIDDQVLTTIRVGDLLLVEGGYPGGTTAYRLPDGAEDLPIPAGKDNYAATEWAEEDLRDDPMVDPCAGVAPATVRALGLEHASELPAPLGCVWEEGERRLSVQVTVNRPNEDAAAIDVAKQGMEEIRATGLEEAEDPDLGDTVLYAATASVGSGEYDDIPHRTVTDARLVVRRANVVVDVTYGEGMGTYGRPRQLPLAGSVVQAGVRAAAEEALAAWEEPGSDPTAGADGAVTTLPDPCPIGADQVERVLPGTAARDLTAPGEERLRGCRWQRGAYGDFVQVTAAAIGPNAITGADADAEARRVFDADDRSGLARPVRGPWDQAWIQGEDNGYSDGWRLAVLKDNVMLVVQINLTEQPGSDARAAAIDIGRRYLAAIER